MSCNLHGALPLVAQASPMDCSIKIMNLYLPAHCRARYILQELHRDPAIDRFLIVRLHVARHLVVQHIALYLLVDAHTKGMVATMTCSFIICISILHLTHLIAEPP